MNEYSNSATLQFLNLGSLFASWASSCIDALIDDIASRSSDVSRKQTVVTSTGTGMEISYRDKMGVRVVAGHLVGDPGTLEAMLRTEFKGKSGRGIILRVGGGKVVVKQISLPAGALEVLPAVVRNKIESLAPWPLNEAIWGYRTLPAAQPGQIAVEVGILSRTALDYLLAIFERAGLRVDHLQIAGSGQEGGAVDVDFLKPRRAERVRRALVRITSIACGLALITAAYGSYQVLRTNSKLSWTEARIASLRQALRGEGMDAENPKLQAANKLYDRKKSGPPLIVVLNTLTKLVPDDIWLNSINFQDNQLVITGRGVAVPRLVEILEQSGSFTGTSFSSATQRDPSHNTDIFSITTNIKPTGTGS